MVVAQHYKCIKCHRIFHLILNYANFISIKKRLNMVSKVKKKFLIFKRQGGGGEERERWSMTEKDMLIGTA